MSEITTAEELDALPVGSVVLDEAGVAWQRQAPPNEDARSFWRAADVSHAAFGSQLSGYDHRFRCVSRPDTPTLSDAALVEEAARRGMTVMDAAEAARLRAEVERLTEHSIFANHISWRIAEAVGDVPEGAESIEGDPDEQLTRLIAERDHLRAGIEALADEWERNRAALLAGGVGEGMLSFRDAASRLRALLSADDEAVE